MYRHSLTELKTGFVPVGYLATSGVLSVPPFIWKQCTVTAGDGEMSSFDPVSWETREATLGPPAAEIPPHIEKMKGELYDKDPYEAVKTIHDALYDDDVDRTVPNLGEPFITAYLLEKEGIINANDTSEGEYRSIVARRPSKDRLRELFWEQEYTLWWIGLLTGVHPSLVTYWFYEYDIPLMERNYTEEAMDQIRAYRESNK